MVAPAVVTPAVVAPTSPVVPVVPTTPTVVPTGPLLPTDTSTASTEPKLTGWYTTASETKCDSYYKRCTTETVHRTDPTAISTVITGGGEMLSYKTVGGEGCVKDVNGICRQSDMHRNPALKYTCEKATKKCTIVTTDPNDPKKKMTTITQDGKLISTTLTDGTTT